MSSPVIAPSTSLNDDPNSPFHIYPSDNPGIPVIFETLTGDNYRAWKDSVEMSLAFKTKLGFIDGSIPVPAKDETAKYTAWSRVNALLRSWLVYSLSPEIRTTLLHLSTAKDIWEEIAFRYKKSDGPRLYHLAKTLRNLNQGTQNLTTYYNLFKTFRDEYISFRPIPKTCQVSFQNLQEQESVLQFLVGLNDSYSLVRSQILMTSPMPTLSKVYAILRQEESQRSLSLSSVTPTTSLLSKTNSIKKSKYTRKVLQKEQEEKEDKKISKDQARLYTIIKVARDEDLREQIGKDICFDLVDHDKVCNFRIQKQTPFNHFKEEVAKEFGIPVQFQRFWIWAKRQNGTYRPNRPLTTQEEAQTVGSLRDASNKAHNAYLKLFLEVEFGLDLHPIPPVEINKNDILLFFKLYDPEKEELRYVGKLFVKYSAKPIEIQAKLNEMAGFAPNEAIEFFEEINFEPTVMCVRIDKRASFRFSQIEDGDIVCFQKQPPTDRVDKIRFPEVPSYLEYMKNRQIVHFRALDKPKEDDFFLELSKSDTYDDVVERVAKRLHLDDPSKIRLTPHNCYSQQPKPNPIKYRSVDHLIDMLVHYNQISDILYYEVLDIPLPELQCLKTLKIAFHHATKDEAIILNIRLPKQSTVGDVLNEIKTKVELSHPNSELRLLEVFYHKIYKIFPMNEKIENINDQYWTLRAEEIPEEEKSLGPNDRLIHVYHFTKDAAQNQAQVQNFGEPFFLVIREGETLAEVKARIQKKLQVPDEDFSKWKFAFLSLGRPEYLEDTDIVSSRFQKRDVYGAWEQYLGLEHSDTNPRRAYAANPNRHAYEKPVKIYN